MSEATTTEKKVLTKTELGKTIAELNDITQAAAISLVEQVFDEIQEAVVQGNTVSISKFGQFIPVVKPERNARNPKTGETIVVPAKNAMKFKQSSSLKKFLA